MNATALTAADTIAINHADIGIRLDTRFEALSR
jgi:hypothetical protein